MDDEYLKKRIYSINHPGMKQEEMVHGYVNWTNSYEQLQKLGFTHMDALDPIPEMLNLARQKGIYENYHEVFLSADKQTNIPSNTYDCVTAAGCFSENHIPWNVLPELIRLVKPGGLIIIATKVAESEYFKDFDKFVDELVRDGKLATADRLKDRLCFKGTNGLTYALKVTR